MTETLNAIVAPDHYTHLATIEGVPIRNVLLDVSNAAIYWQVQQSLYGGHAGVWDSAETYMPPGSRSVPQTGLTGIRVRAAIPGLAKPAIVTVTAVTSADA